MDGVGQTAFVWYHGMIASLGTLGRADCPSCSSENAATSMAGVSVVLSETSTPDTYGEDFCGFGSRIGNALPRSGGTARSVLCLR